MVFLTEGCCYMLLLNQADSTLMMESHTKRPFIKYVVEEKYILVSVRLQSAIH